MCIIISWYVYYHIVICVSKYRNMCIKISSYVHHLIMICKVPYRDIYNTITKYYLFGWRVLYVLKSSIYILFLYICNCYMNMICIVLYLIVIFIAPPLNITYLVVDCYLYFLFYCENWGFLLYVFGYLLITRLLSIVCIKPTFCSDCIIKTASILCRCLPLSCKRTDKQMLNKTP